MAWTKNKSFHLSIKGKSHEQNQTQYPLVKNSPRRPVARKETIAVPFHRNWNRAGRRDVLLRAGCALPHRAFISYCRALERHWRTYLSNISIAPTCDPSFGFGRFYRRFHRQPRCFSTLVDDTVFWRYLFHLDVPRHILQRRILSRNHAGPE